MIPRWTKLFPSRAEIKQYEDDVVNQYGLRKMMTFRTEVRKCVWREDANRWLLFLVDLETGLSSAHECQILFAATGQLIEPNPCDIPGASSFKGALFHSARWDHSVDLRGKDVLVVGNGCKSMRINEQIFLREREIESFGSSSIFFQVPRLKLCQQL